MVRVGSADIVAHGGAVVHECHAVGEDDVSGLVVDHVDQKIAEIVSLVEKLAIAVMEGGVVEETAEMHLHVGDTSAATGDDVGAVAELFDEFFTQCLGCVAVALMVEVFAATGEFLGIVAVQSQPFEQAYHGHACGGCILVYAARYE